MTRTHVPVLAAEVIELGDPGPGDTVVDCTFGAGGHSRLIADRIGPTGTLVAIDRDPAAEERFEELAGEVVCETRFVRASYAEGLEELADEGLEADLVLFDLGVSSMQLDARERGFSYSYDAPLDMRMDPTRGTLGGRPGGRARARPPGSGVPDLRRGAPCAAHRPRDRPPARERAHRDDGRAGGGHRGRRPGACPPRLRGRPSRAPGLPGAADRGQRRARRARSRAARRLRPAPPRRPGGGDLLPLAGGPSGQALPGRPRPGVHLPARLPHLRLRPRAGGRGADRPRHRAQPG